jgi:hypothetical protein
MIRALALPRRPALWLALALLTACMPPQEPESNGPSSTGGRSGSGGSNASGGKSGSGGSGGGGASSGGSSGSGGSSSGGSSGSGGAGGSGGGSGGTSSGGSPGSGGSGAGGSGSGGAGAADAGKDAGKTDAPAIPNAEGTWANLELALSGCVFCHPGEVAVPRNSDFSDMSKLHDILLGTTTHVSAACQFKTIVVPGKPMESLMYLKLLDNVPAGCGVKMPMGKASDPWVTEVVKNWITAGAPAK